MNKGDDIRFQNLPDFPKSSAPVVPTREEELAHAVMATFFLFAMIYSAKLAVEDPQWPPVLSFLVSGLICYQLASQALNRRRGRLAAAKDLHHFQQGIRKAVSEIEAD